MHKLLCSVTLLLLTIVLPCDAQELADPFIERADGSFYYIVQEADDLGQWGVARGKDALWLKLVEANPQLADPNLIQPGQMLNVPRDLALDFYRNGYTRSGTGIGLFQIDTSLLSAPPPPSSTNPYEWTYAVPWVLISWMLLGTAVVVALLFWRQARRIRTMQTERESEREERAEEDRQRQLADPYTGPPVVPGGLPSAEAAEANAIRQYGERRDAMPVGESRQLPERVHIVSTRAVDVRGPMTVTYGNGTTEEKNLTEWTPAWQVDLSDGTSTITLMACGNDVVFSGRRTEVEQVREREDVPVAENNTVVWDNGPVDPAEQAQAVADAAPSPENTGDDSPPVVDYRKVTFTSPTRVVLIPADESQPERPLELSALGGLINIAVRNGEIHVETQDGRNVQIGRIVGDSTTSPESETPADAGAPDGPSAEDGPTEPAEPERQEA